MRKNKDLLFFEIFLEYSFLLILGGSIYYGIELLYRGFSHPTMVLVGGLCFICIGLINEVLPWETKFWKQVLIGDLMVLVIEFFSGCIINLWLGLGVWDYSDLPMNLFGQICLPFAVMWLPIVAIGVVLDDWVKYLLGKGDRPKYTWF